MDTRIYDVAHWLHARKSAQEGVHIQSWHFQSHQREEQTSCAGATLRVLYRIKLYLEMGQSVQSAENGPGETQETNAWWVLWDNATSWHDPSATDQP